MSYIKRETALEFVMSTVPHINGETTIKCVERAIKEAPTADVVEVRHGHWIDKSRNINGLHDPRFDCSVCGHIFWFQGAETFNYCPACGAKMDGERSENGKS